MRVELMRCGRWWSGESHVHQLVVQAVCDFEFGYLFVAAAVGSTTVSYNVCTSKPKYFLIYRYLIFASFN